MKVKGDRLTISMTAGEALTEGDALYISAANTVKKTTDALATSCGVADADASSGASVDVVIYGKKSVTADGSISAGDRVVGATTAGRVVAGGIPLTGKGGAVTNDVGEDGSHGLETGAASDDYIDAGFVIGKALGAATSGDSVDILVCLS